MKKLSYLLGILGIIGVGLVMWPTLGKAYQSFFTRHYTAIATTTVAYMTPGTASTTLSWDNYTVDESFLFIQFAAARGSSTLAWNEQFSNNNVDWYEEDNVAPPVGVTAISRFDHASTTVTHYWAPNSSVTATSTARKMIKLSPSASYYRRVVFTAPIGGNAQTGELWAEVTAKRNPGY